VRREAATVASAEAVEAVEATRVTVGVTGEAAEAATSPVEREVALAAPVAADVVPAASAVGMAEIGADEVAAPVAPRKKRVSRKALPA
jgi:hypothetical protein